MKPIYKHVLLFSLFLLVMVLAIKFSGITTFCTLDTVKQQSAYLMCLVQQYYWPTVMVYLIVYTVFIAASLPSVGPLSIAGGFMFGFVPGLIYSLLGSLFGAMIAFSVLRKMTARLHDAQLTPRMAKFKAGLDKWGHVYLLMLHFSILAPFIVINTLAALAHISWSTFIWITVVGMIPAASIYVFAGTQLASIRSMSDLFSWPVIIALCLLMVLMVVPLLIARRKHVEV